MITTKPLRPQRIERVRRQLERWRRTRAHPRSPIPDPVWAAAVALVPRHGLYQTARGLRINYGALKEHVAAAGPARTARPGVPSGFVELAGRPPADRDEYVIEIDGPRATLRLRLPGMAITDLAQLSRALAGVDA